MQFRQQKAELASQLDSWTLSKLNATLFTVTYQVNVKLNGENEELHWPVAMIETKLKTNFPS